MRLGPLELQVWHIAILVVLLGLLGWLIRGFLIRVSGTWERVDEGLGPGQSERLSLAQFGPFVRGRRMMPGGFQEYSGILRGRTLFMTRRDHGRPFIVRQGFPEAVAAEVDGTVTAKLRLTLSASGDAIFGSFTPQKIEFTHQPPTVTRRRFLEPSFRRYRLVSRTIETEESPEVLPRSGSKPFRKTV